MQPYFGASSTDLGQDAAVGHHDDELRSQRADILVLAAVPQGAGLKDGGAVGQRHFLHRGCGEHLLAAHGLIAPGVDRADVVARLIQGLSGIPPQCPASP